MKSSRVGLVFVFGVLSISLVASANRVVAEEDTRPKISTSNFNQAIPQQNQIEPLTLQSLSGGTPGGGAMRQDMAANRGYTAGKFPLETDPKEAGWIVSVEGGVADSEVVTSKIPPSGPVAVPYPNMGAVQKAFGKPNIEPEAYFNPKEMSVDKSVPWQKHKNAEGDEPTLEFTAAEPKKMAVDLMFDSYEKGATVGDGAKLGGRISEMTIPEMDGSSKEPAVMQKDKKVDALTVKETAATDEVGDERDYDKEPTAAQDDTTLTLQTEPEPKVSFSRTTPIHVRVRAEGNETSALGSLRTISTAQKMYVEDDKDEGGDFDYAKPLDPTIKHGNLVESVLGVPEQKGEQKEPATKYKLFLPDGTPVRATVNLKMTELEGPATKGEAESAPEDNSATADSGKDEDDDSK